MGWTVETLNENVDAEIAALPKDMQAAFYQLGGRIEAVGLDHIGAPHVRKIRGKISEMRLNGRDGIGRALYVTVIGRRVVVLYAFMKKTPTTPSRAIETAERRAKDIII
jgi:phage-related protein